MKNIILVLFIGVLLVKPYGIYAEYTLPYPSYMPGHRLYRIARVFDEIKRYWSWGTIASLHYHRSLADTYLVEAKTLFEYKQYLLAVSAFMRSTNHVDAFLPYVVKAEEEGKMSDQLKVLLCDALRVHKRTIENFSVLLPDNYLWTPEKDTSTPLELGEMLKEGRDVRSQTAEILRCDTTQ